MTNIIYELATSFLDVFLVAVLIYFVLRVIVRSERYVIILSTLVISILVFFIANVLKLNTLLMILDSVFNWSIIILVILFQEEIRNYLNKTANLTIFTNKPVTPNDNFINGLVESCFKMAKTKTGALITIKCEDDLTKYTKSAVKIDAEFSQFLIISIFNKEAPIHDGAVVIENNRVKYASTYFPIALDMDISKKYGTRHRAALTISKLTDSISIMVSEETGEISIAFNGNLYSDVEEEFLKAFLSEKLEQE